jgi:glycosyltransferase involved in cell wall biosynthesis
MSTLHLIYAVGDGIRTPGAITRELACRLSKHYEVKVHDWADKGIIKPDSGDILLGHPHPDGNTIFRRSFSQCGWGKRIVMLPFRHAPYYGDIAWWDPLICKADCFIAICAPYWTDTMAQSWTAHWAYKTIQLDLAVNREHYPLVKTRFNPPGKRKFLFIGWVARYKGFDYFEEIVRANSQLSFGWIGPGDNAVECPGLEKHGYRDFSLRENMDLVKTYDFLLTCGRSDPNPTTILEATSWGLVPICTPQSGYYKQDWIINIPLDNVAAASAILRDLNTVPEEVLRQFQERGQTALSSHYTWRRFAAQVRDCIEKPSPSIPKGLKWKFIKGRNRNMLLLYGMMARLTPIKVKVQQFVHFLRARWWKMQTVLKSG